MNAIIHLATGFGIALTIIDAQSPKACTLHTTGLAVAGFAAGIIVHALLDYAPHCYPVNSRVDFISSLILLGVLIVTARKQYRLLLCCCLTGSVLPDIADLLPTIVNKQLGWHLPVSRTPLFPWHQQIYSGSVYSGDCGVSNLNTGMVLAAVTGIVLLKRKGLRAIFSLKISTIYKKPRAGRK